MNAFNLGSEKKDLAAECLKEKLPSKFTNVGFHPRFLSKVQPVFQEQVTLNLWIMNPWVAYRIHLLY